MATNKMRDIKCPKCKHKFEESTKETKSVCPRCNHVFSYVPPSQIACGCLVLTVIGIIAFTYAMNSCAKRYEDLAPDKSPPVKIEPIETPVKKELTETKPVKVEPTKEEIAAKERAKEQAIWEANQERKISDGKTGAWVYAQYAVEECLRSPSTAKFPWVGSSHTSHQGGNIYVVRSYVDSQNAFGATIRTKFTCKLKWLGGRKFDLIELTFD